MAAVQMPFGLRVESRKKELEKLRIRTDVTSDSFDFSRNMLIHLWDNVSEYKTEKSGKFWNKYCGGTAKDEQKYYQNVLGPNR